MNTTFYVYTTEDFDGEISISNILPEYYFNLIGDYKSKEAAEKAVSDYKEYIEREVEKATGNFYEEDYYDDDEDYYDEL